MIADGKNLFAVITKTRYCDINREGIGGMYYSIYEE